MQSYEFYRNEALDNFGIKLHDFHRLPTCQIDVVSLETDHTCVMG